MPPPTRRRSARPRRPGARRASARPRRSPAGCARPPATTRCSAPAARARAAQPRSTPKGRGHSARPLSAAGRVAASDRVTSTAGKAKVGFYQAPDDTARARAAYDWTRPQEGHRSFSDFISAAVMREVARLETKYHDSEPWPALEPGRLPTGKPLGS